MTTKIYGKDGKELVSYEHKMGIAFRDVCSFVDKLMMAFPNFGTAVVECGKGKRYTVTNN